MVPSETRHTSCADLGPVAKFPLHLLGLPEQGVPPGAKLSLTPGAGLCRGRPAASESSTQTPTVCPVAGAPRRTWPQPPRRWAPESRPGPPGRSRPGQSPHPHACPPRKAASFPEWAHVAGSADRQPPFCGCHDDKLPGWRARLNTDLGRLEPV